MTELDPQPEKANLNLESVAKLAGASILALYVLGLLAINGYLFSIGSTDFSLVRPRFVYTGALIVTFALVYILIPVYFALYGRTHSILAAVFLGLFGCTGAVIILTGVLVFTNSSATGDAIKTILNLYIVIILCGILPGIMILVYMNIKDDWTPLKISRLAAVATVAIAAIITYSLAFMLWVFPKLPDQFGGGRPTRVQLLIKKDEVDGVRSLGLLFEDMSQSSIAPSNKRSTITGAVTTPVDLMYEGSEAYVIRLAKNTFIRLDRDIVLGLKVKH
jgi:hypothetical protein